MTSRRKVTDIDRIAYRLHKIGLREEKIGEALCANQKWVSNAIQRARTEDWRSRSGRTKIPYAGAD